jgi:hypothetical protein
MKAMSKYINVQTVKISSGFISSCYGIDWLFSVACVVSYLIINIFACFAKLTAMAGTMLFVPCCKHFTIDAGLLAPPGSGFTLQRKCYWKIGTVPSPF